jgi:hypothetical protein
MWFLNVVLPVVIGSYYVLNFKTKNPIWFLCCPSL